MSKYRSIINVIAVVIMTAAIVACGTDRHHFQLEGRFLKMNMGEFYVYSPDGMMAGVDTIHVKGGRFAYEIPCEHEGTIVIVLPNFSELPVFVKPGKSVDMKADASHIKDIEITGTDENDRMTEWRKSIDGMSPPDQRKQAEDFIRKNPQTIMAQWLLRKFFLQITDADLKKANELMKVIESAGNKSASLSHLAEGLQRVAQAGKGDKLPTFSVTDIYGKKVSSADLMSGKVIILVGAAWNYDAINQRHTVEYKLKKAKEEGHGGAKIITISLDASDKITRNRLRNDSIPWPVVCDGKMWDSPLVKTLGISSIPDNIIVNNGKIIGRHLSTDDVVKELEK